MSDSILPTTPQARPGVATNAGVDYRLPVWHSVQTLIDTLNEFVADLKAEPSWALAPRPEPKHTPGPWKIEPEHETEIVDERDVRTIAHFYGVGSQEEHSANILLCTAAPELYAGCETMLAFLGTQAPTMENIRLYGTIEAALKKARGEA